MNDSLILAIDVGTQSLRCALINKRGEIEGIAKEVYEQPYIVERKGGAVQHPDFYYNLMVKAIQNLKKEKSELFNRIIGMCLDTVRDTAVLLDDHFNPITPSVLWLDQRLASGSMRKRPFWQPLAFRLVGMYPTMKLNFRKSMSLWFQENRPDLWDRTRHYGNISSYLTYKMTGEFKDSPASIIGHYPLDFKKREYYKSQKALKNIYNIPNEYLPELIQPGGVLGTITNQFAKETGLAHDLPLYSCGSDKACESLGLGVLEPGVAAISLGTASTIEVTTEKYLESEPFLPAYPFCIPGYYNMDVQIYRGYWMLNWFLKTFCHIDVNNVAQLKESLEDFNMWMMKIPPGCDGLILQPYWQPGLARPLSKGAVVGFTDSITSVHFYRAIVEGISFALREAMEHFEKKTHKKIVDLMISGGGSNSDEICQITADIFGIPVSRVQTFETSLLGAAISGFLAAKEFMSPKDAVREMVHKSKTFIPNQSNHDIYNNIYWKGYRKMYPNLSRIYKHTNKN